jgi:hypothetical protein
MALLVAEFVLLGLLFGGEPVRGDASSLKGTEARLEGRALLLSEVLKARGIPADAEPAGREVVVEGSDGSIVPLISTVESRALFLDERLRGRFVRVQGLRFPGLPAIQVVNFQVREEAGGPWKTPEYYCDVCTISVRYPQVCPCCQGDMELRMREEPSGE